MAFTYETAECSPEELEVLDDRRFTARMPSHAAAVRELLKAWIGVGETWRRRYGPESQEG